jgi:hypothetical protein
MGLNLEKKVLNGSFDDCVKAMQGLSVNQCHEIIDAFHDYYLHFYADHPLVKVEPSPSRKELVECIQNLMGIFDTPVARMRIKGEYADEARKIGRQILETNEMK